MLFSHEPVKKAIRDARRVFWWTLALEIFSLILPELGLGMNAYALLLLASSATLILLYLILFFGFSKLAKHFHRMHLFWFFVVMFIFNAYFTVVDVIKKLFFYDTYMTNEDILSVIIILTGAVLSFVYGYYIMELPKQKFGAWPFYARVANIGKALLLPAIVYMDIIIIDSNLMSALSTLISFGIIIIVFACYYIDFVILGKALKSIDTASSRSSSHKTAH